jgi:hypothetical protein
VSEGAAAAEEVAAAHSTLSWRGLRDLLFAPRRFFSRGLGVADRPEVTFVAWIVGVSLALDRVDRFAPLMESWAGTWIFVLLASILLGALRWYIGGWFYGVRLGWCDVDDPPDELVRSINAWQDFVRAAPQVLWAIGATFVYENYAEASSEMAFAGIVLAIFIFWSCITSYVGATTAFPKAHRGYAAVWFIVVPLLFHTLIMIIAAT